MGRNARTAAAFDRMWDTVDVYPWLSEVRVPTLLTTRGIDPAEAAYVASLMPRATRVTLDGSDFMPFFDRGQFIGALRDFIRHT